MLMEQTGRSIGGGVPGGGEAQGHIHDLMSPSRWKILEKSCELIHTWRVVALVTEKEGECVQKGCCCSYLKLYGLECHRRTQRGLQFVQSALCPCRQKSVGDRGMTPGPQGGG